MPCPEKFKESLQQFGVNEDIIHQINTQYEDLLSSSPRKQKAAYFQRAIEIMDQSRMLKKNRKFWSGMAVVKAAPD